MKDGAILGNAGHFNVEVDVEALEKLAQDTYEARPNIMATECQMEKCCSLLQKAGS